MSIAQGMLPELQHELATTRKFLERIPEAQAGWTPHPKSMTLGALAVHIAEMAGWAAPTLQYPEFDLHPAGGEAYQSPPFTTTAALVAMFDAAVPQALAALAATSDEAMMQPWALKRAGTVLMQMPRAVVLRSMILNHIVHHRAQLGLYLRMLDVPVPAAYGNTADDRGHA
ncbi:MAG: DinB family protein [Gemmatimonadales bacterium]|nr:DinB family protein [Gemmatimonadales bacterium]